MPSGAFTRMRVSRSPVAMDAVFELFDNKLLIDNDIDNEAVPMGHAGHSALRRWPSSRSSCSRTFTSSPATVSRWTISVAVFSSSTCSIRNH